MCDSSDLYRRCTSTDLHEVHAGFQQLGRCLLPVARYRLNKARFDQTEVEDCVQKALSDIWQKLKQGYRPYSPNTFLGWAITIVHRRCLDYIRYTARRPTEVLTHALTEDSSASLAAVDPAVNQPDVQTLRVEQKLTLLLSIRRHPKVSSKSKTVLIDGFLFEKTDEELAWALLTTKGNIRLTRHRNLEKLRQDADFMMNLRKLYVE